MSDTRLSTTYPNKLIYVKTMIEYAPQKKDSTKSVWPFVTQAIDTLVKNQISDTLILSSYKINTVIKNYFGKNFKAEVVGRCLARLAKHNSLKRIKTRIPKYELRKSNFSKFTSAY